jgi:lipoyl(octanoyl) transferase
MRRTRSALASAASAAGSPRPVCHAFDVGVVPYLEAWRWQQSMLARRTSSAPSSSTSSGPQHKNALLVLQHPHVYTLGRAAVVEHLLWDGAQAAAASGALDSPLSTESSSSEARVVVRGPGGSEVHRVERGGKVTYHGPGQLVMYPVLDLRQFRQDLHWYVTCVEEVVVRTLAHYGVRGEREKGNPGVWVRGRKVAAVGMACSKWYTSHGLALNVDADLSYFGRIVPCGLDGREVTSLQAEVQAAAEAGEGGGERRRMRLTVDDVKPVALRAFQEVFGCELVMEVSGTRPEEAAAAGGGTGG